MVRSHGNLVVARLLSEPSDREEDAFERLAHACSAAFLLDETSFVTCLCKMEAESSRVLPTQYRRVEYEQEWN